MLFDWTGFFRKIPLLHDANTLIRIIGYAIIAITLFVFWIIVAMIAFQLGSVIL